MNEKAQQDVLTDSQNQSISESLQDIAIGANLFVHSVDRLTKSFGRVTRLLALVLLLSILNFVLIALSATTVFLIRDTQVSVSSVQKTDERSLQLIEYVLDPNGTYAQRQSQKTKEFLNCVYASEKQTLQEATHQPITPLPKGC